MSSPKFDTFEKKSLTCAYCKKNGHLMADCFRLQKKNERDNKPKSSACTTPYITSTLECPASQAFKSSFCDYMEEYKPFMSDGFISIVDDTTLQPIKILRDTGASQSLLLEGVLPLSEKTSVGASVLLQGVELGCIDVPLHRIYLKSDLITGPVVVGVRPNLPVEGVTLLLGNDLARNKVVAEPIVTSEPVVDVKSPEDDAELYPACVVTRAMARKQQNENLQEDKFDYMDLSDTFIADIEDPGNSEKAIIKPPSVNKNVIMPWPDVNSHSLDRNNLLEEQHKDPELIYMAIVLYGPSLALNAVTGISLWGSMIAVCAVCTLYTALGGMKAVVWTDTIQVLIMFSGMLILLIFGCKKLEGLDVAWRVADENDRIKFFILNPDPSERHSVWNMIVGGGFIWTGVYGINQAQVQRAVSFSSLSKAKLSLWVNLVCIVSILSLVCLVGVVMFAYYSTCDPVLAGIVTKSDQLIPLFAMDVVGDWHGLPGLVISCIFSGSLSTVSSGFNAISAIILKDFVLVCAPNMPSGTRTIISKLIVLLAGGVCLAVAYVMSQLTSSILTATITIYGLLGGPLLGVFTLGMLFPWANKWVTTT
ncbi:Hypothetical predicted protein [Mytilus galloprovincialis]|uniref:Uncharacterized protein n=1 Tax=Mytilus galloprovincialis TaxID=29158 RepID=A0A8B6E2R9_MYTGA|nr:Hypothetical predicted protein [Mytilus galloprovincialis]